MPEQDIFQNRNFENQIITDIVNDANEDTGVNKNVATPIDDKNATTPIDDVKVTTIGNDDSIYDEVSYASEILSCASEVRPFISAFKMFISCVLMIIGKN